MRFWLFRRSQRWFSRTVLSVWFDDGSWHSEKLFGPLTEEIPGGAVNLGDKREIFEDGSLIVNGVDLCWRLIWRGYCFCGIPYSILRASARKYCRRGGGASVQICRLYSTMLILLSSLLYALNCITKFKDIIQICVLVYYIYILII